MRWEKKTSALKLDMIRKIRIRNDNIRSTWYPLCKAWTGGSIQERWNEWRTVAYNVSSLSNMSGLNENLMLHTVWLSFQLDQKLYKGVFRVYQCVWVLSLPAKSIVLGLWVLNCSTDSPFAMAVAFEHWRTNQCWAKQQPPEVAYISGGLRV